MEEVKNEAPEAKEDDAVIATPDLNFVQAVSAEAGSP